MESEEVYPMRVWIRVSVVAIAGALSLGAILTSGQTTAYRAPRTSDGKPNLSGVWQSLSTANWDLEDHSAQPGPPQLGAIGAIPPGMGVVDGGEIPYKPEAAAKKKANFASRMTLDPEAKCYLPGIPRATYMPYPFQIIQSTKDILMVYGFASANRLINMGKPQEAPTDTWMGTSNGRWEGETLVIDVIGLNGLAWFDRAGNFASDSLHVVERFTAVSADRLLYEATIDDTKVFTRPWKISMPLYRHAEKNAQVLDFKCVEFSEELLYGKFKKQTNP